MLSIFINFSRNFFEWNFPQVFDSCSVRMLFSLITSFIFVVFLGRFVIRKLKKLNFQSSVREVLTEFHGGKDQIPTMGGILILGASIFSLIVWNNWKISHTYHLLFTLISFGILGFVDDFMKIKSKSNQGLTAKRKFFFQILLSFILVYFLRNISIFNKNTPDSSQFSIFMPFFKNPFVYYGIAKGIIYYFLVIFILVGTSNSVNLTDGLDGLAAGCVALAAITFMVFGFVSNNFELSRYLNILYIEGSGEIAIFLSSVVGGCLGFLWFNGFPAEIFMGDTGALPLGAVLGMSAILLKREILLVIVGGVFVLESLSVILQIGSCKIRKKKLFLCSPLHHHFQYKKIPENKIVLRFWLVGLALALIGVLSLMLQ